MACGNCNRSGGHEDESPEDLERDLPDESDMDSTDEPGIMPCPHCRKLISEDAEVCDHCRKRVLDDDSAGGRSLGALVILILTLLAIAGIAWLAH
jgi:hypothetical protein